MKTLIAVAGKGGTGKTTLLSLIIRTLSRQTQSLLAIDADPNNNLWQWLGLKHAKSVMEIVEDINKKKESIPPGMTKQRYIDFKIQESIEESSAFDLLSMGRPEGPGCYCYANNLLRDIIERLSTSYEYVCVDNEAGMEHLSRRLMRKIDLLFIVSDFSIVGIRSAHNISNLIDSLDIKVGQKLLVVNRVMKDTTSLKEEIDKTKIKLAGFIPYDKNLEEISLKGGSVFDLKTDSPASGALDNILENSSLVTSNK